MFDVWGTPNSSLDPLIHLGVSIVMGVPQNRWKLYFMENPNPTNEDDPQQG